MDILLETCFPLKILSRFTIPKHLSPSVEKSTHGKEFAEDCVMQHSVIQVYHNVAAILI